MGTLTKADKVSAAKKAWWQTDAATVFVKAHAERRAATRCGITRPCVICSKEIYRSRGRAKASHWVCSRECARAWWNANKALLTLPCRGCGEPVTRQRAQFKNNTPFCSRQCRQRHHSVDTPCEVCGKVVHRKASHAAKIKKGTYCSRECRHIAALRRERASVKKCRCVTCGASVLRNPADTAKVFCSAECKAGEYTPCRVCPKPIPYVPGLIKKMGLEYCSKRCRANDSKIVVECPWPECPESAEVRRSESVWGAARGNRKKIGDRYFTFCAFHRSAVAEVLGESFTMRPFGRILRNIKHAYPIRDSASLSVRVFVFLKSGKACAACGTVLNFRDTKSWEMDHIQAAGLGGKTTLSNLQALCKRCHIAKTQTDRRAIKAIRNSKPASSRPWLSDADKDALIDYSEARIRALESEASAQRQEIERLTREREHLAQWVAVLAPRGENIAGETR